MTDLPAAPDLAELAAKMVQTNPGNTPGKTEAEFKRIPMSTPQRRLEMPDIPGYFTQWFLDASGRIQQAIRAGFEFVNPDEVQGNATGLGSDPLSGASTDMGTRVSIADGAGRMYFMKQKLEHYNEDQAIRQAGNDRIAETLTSGTAGAGQAGGETQADVAQRFVDKTRTNIPDLFRKKPTKGAT